MRRDGVKHNPTVNGKSEDKLVLRSLCDLSIDEMDKIIHKNPMLLFNS